MLLTLLLVSGLFVLQMIVSISFYHSILENIAHHIYITENDKKKENIKNRIYAYSLDIILNCLFHTEVPRSTSQ